MKKLYLSTLLVFCFQVQSQIITTIAGGTAGFSGDGGPATLARLSSPTCVAIDAIGNIYFSDYDNNCVRVINQGGIISTFAGGNTSGLTGDGGPATAAFVHNPLGLTFDTYGNLYIAEESRVRKVDVAGIITTVAGGGSSLPGDGGAATNASLSPYRITFDKKGNLFISDGYKVRKVNHSGIITSAVNAAGTGGYSGDGGQATAASMNAGGMAFDAIGNLYVVDNYHKNIRKIDTLGIISTFAGTGPGYGGDGGSSIFAGFYYPNDICFDAQCNMYISDGGNRLIRQINTTKVINSVVGKYYGEACCGNYSGDGGPATNAQLNNPGGMAFDAFGNLYFADINNAAIRKVTPINSPVTASVPVKYQRIYNRQLPSGNNNLTVLNNSNKDYMLTCSLLNTSGYQTILLVKTDTLGDTLWSRNYLAAWPGNISKTAAIKTNDGGYLVGGNQGSTGPATLIKTNALGDTTWTRTYNSFGISSSLQLADGSYICGGNTGQDNNPYSGGGSYPAILKTNSLGDTLWAKCYDNNNTGATINSMVKTLEGGYLLCGQTPLNSNNGAGVILIKTDSLGNQIWANYYYGLNTNNATTPSYVEQVADGGYIVVGQCNDISSSSINLTYVLKVSSTGVVQWSKVYKGYLTFASSIKQTADKGFIIGGVLVDKHDYHYNRFLLTKTDSLGHVIWSKAYTDSLGGSCNYVAQTADAGYISIGNLQQYIYVVKTDKNGSADCYQENILNLVDSSFTFTTVNLYANTFNIAAHNRPFTIIKNTGITTQQGIHTNYVCGLNAIPSGSCSAVFYNPTTDVNQLNRSLSSIAVYPNPAQSKVIIDATGVNQIILYDVLGNQISNTNQKEIDVSNLQNGVYFISVKAINGISTQKIIVQH